MNVSDGVVAVTMLLSPVGAILAWLAKLRWSKEYTSAKDETIRAKEAQVAMLTQQLQTVQELSPMRIREYFLSVKDQLEEYNERLKTELQEVKDERDNALAAAAASGTSAKQAEAAAKAWEKRLRGYETALMTTQRTSAHLSEVIDNRSYQSLMTEMASVLPRLRPPSLTIIQGEEGHARIDWATTDEPPKGSLGNEPKATEGDDGDEGTAQTG